MHQSGDSTMVCPSRHISSGPLRSVSVTIMVRNDITIGHAVADVTHPCMPAIGESFLHDAGSD